MADGWRVKVGAVAGLLPPPQAAPKRVIGGLGIDNDSHVVVVPGGRQKADFNAAARVYWTFKVLGHDNVSILDGGDKAGCRRRQSGGQGRGHGAPKKFVARLRPEYSPPATM